MIRQANVSRPIEEFEFRSGNVAPIYRPTLRVLKIIEGWGANSPPVDEMRQVVALLMPDATSDDILDLEDETLSAILQLASDEKDAVLATLANAGNASGAETTAQASAPGTTSTTSSRGSRGDTGRSRTRSSTRTSRPSPGTT